MKLDREKIFMIVAAVFVLVFGAMYFIGGERGAVVLTQQNQPSPDRSIENISDEAAQILIVHIAGEVKSPGVYELVNGSRVMDALDLAGGPTDEADLDRVNLAAHLSDAQQVVIPKARAEGEPDPGGYAYDTQSKLVNVNTADLRALMTLPGVGEVTAGNIIAYREKNGAFKQIADIKNVPRIGERTFEQLQDLIAVD